MIIHHVDSDIRGAGRTTKSAGRYIPIAGGSRSRLPVSTSKIRRYYGFVGIDESLTESISTMGALYKFLGGRPELPTGPSRELIATILKRDLDEENEAPVE